MIIHKTAHAVGSTHDYTLFKRSHPDLPDNIRLGLDLGYKGIEKDYPKLKCFLPIKRKNPGRGKRGMKGPDLSPEQKAFNKEFARETGGCGANEFKDKEVLHMGDEFRNRLRHYGLMSDIVCGIVNFRISGRLII